MGKRSKSSPAQSTGPCVEKNSARAALLGVLTARVGGATPTPARFTATALAEVAGVPVEAVRELMRECMVPDEVLVDRGRGVVVATEAGRAKILAALDARMAVPAAAAAPVPVVLEVTKVHGAKRVIATRSDNGRSVLCCLKSSEHLMPGMRLEHAREGEGGLWFYEGRLPRRKGRW